jgi:hypothetical protein
MTLDSSIRAPLRLGSRAVLKLVRPGSISLLALVAACASAPPRTRPVEPRLPGAERCVQDPQPRRLEKGNEAEVRRVAGAAQIPLPSQVIADFRKVGRHEVKAWVRVCLDEQGSVASTCYQLTTGHVGADNHLVREIAGWRYRPFVVDGQARPTCVEVVFNYELH